MDLAELVRLSLAEDIGPGDLTTEACVPIDATGRARIVAKQKLVVAGHAPAAECFRQLGANYVAAVEEGEQVTSGTVVATVTGSLRGLLTAERTALNFLMRLSGIATHTRRVAAACPVELRLVDTRKTTPLHRALEKAAVRAGGAFNHRFALFDGVLIKDNHIAAAGGIAAAVRAAKARVHHLVKVEVEVEDAAQLCEVIAAEADAVLLDNMSDDALAQAVPLAKRAGLLVEVSGNLTPDRLARLAALGVDVASMGGLIHQAPWADLSMKID